MKALSLPHMTRLPTLGGGLIFDLVLEPTKYHAGLGQLLDGRLCGGDRVSVSGRERIFSDAQLPGNTGGVREVLGPSFRSCIGI